MKTSLNGCDSIVTGLVTQYHYNIEKFISGEDVSESHYPISKVEFIVGDGLTLEASDQDNTLNSPIIKITVEFIANKSYNWMFFKEGTKFRVKND